MTVTARLRELGTETSVIDFELLPETVQRTGREPRWSTHDRPFRSTGIEWEGRTPWRLDVSLRFDNLDTDDAVWQLGVLRRWKGEFGSASEPVQLEFRYGNATLSPCVIEDVDVDVDSEVRRASDLATIYCDVRVTLVEYEPMDVVVSPVERREKARAQPAEPKSTRTHTVKRGDTLWGIATEYLGDGSRYPEIAELNDIDDPDLIFPGQEFKIPKR